MGVLNFNAAANRSMPFGQMQNPSDQQPARKDSKLWLNVGYEANGKFISLPLGMAIDTMRAADVRGQNEDFVKQRTAQNQLLESLQKLGFSFQPGQETELNLVVKLRRVNEQLEVVDNEYAIDPASLVKAPATLETVG